jgi:ectoine hydroxylase-related dioxygenase (phytanoyl-CoA dioxygenase family)
MNIPFVDFTDDNGSTEVWPSSHLLTDVDVSQSWADRAKMLPSVRTNMPVGSIILRDTRCWHRGTRNHSKNIRTMMSVAIQSSFLSTKQHYKVSRDTWETLSPKTRLLLQNCTQITSEDVADDVAFDRAFINNGREAAERYKKPLPINPI